MRTKKAGLLTKLVVLALLIATATTLLDLRSRLVEAQTERNQLAQQVTQQSQENDALAAAIDNAGSPESMEAIAREKLGLVAPGEIIFYDASN